MPTLALPALTSWSFSRYSLYKSCPAKFKYKVLLKMEEPSNEAMARGSAIHTLAEQYVQGSLPRLPKELANFKEEFKQLKKEKVKTVEDSWTWTKDWKSETHAKDWKGAWLRVKIDATWTDVGENTLHIVDHKTGKKSDYKQVEYMEQLELYGLAGLKKLPVARVAPVLWYLDIGVVHPPPDEPLVFERKDEKALEKKWAARIKPMFNDKSYKPLPSRGCDWCPYSKKEGGPCQY